MTTKKHAPQFADEVLKRKIDESLDEALEETFPASDPIAPAVPALDEKGAV